MYVNVFLGTCMVTSIHTWCWQRPEEILGLPGVGVADGCKWLQGCWELGLGPLEEQRVL